MGDSSSDEYVQDAVVADVIQQQRNIKREIIPVNNVVRSLT